MGFGQPRPPLMGYGGMSLRLLALETTRQGKILINLLIFCGGQVLHLTHLISLEEAEETMTTSVDKVATWVSRETSGKTTTELVCVLFSENCEEFPNFWFKIM